MKKHWALLGRIGYIFAWPVLYVAVNNSRRSRVIVVHDGQILLVRDWLGDGSWKLPGGGYHSGEAPQIGAQRELLEETGINVDASKLNPLGTIESNKRKVKSLLLVFSLDLSAPAGNLKPGLDIVDVKWLPIDKIADLKISDSTRQILDMFGREVLS